LKILFDHNVDRRLRRHLPGHEIATVREKRWDKLENGSLIRAAAEEGFDVFLSVDKNLEREQNLRTLPLPVIVIDCVSNALPALLPFAPSILKLVQAPLDRLLYVIQSDGVVIRLSAPRLP
jgi:predicted nuclease of predicted toxin-antitoxin system